MGLKWKLWGRSLFGKTLLLLLLAGCSQPDEIHLQNDLLKISFSQSDGTLTGIEDLATSRQLLSGSGRSYSPWVIALNDHPALEQLDVRSASEVSVTRPDSSSLVLRWRNFPDVDSSDGEVMVTASISLDAREPLSYWDISVEGLVEGQIGKLNFPRIAGLEDLGNEKLAVPVWMGQLLDGPREQLSAREEGEKRYEWTYPGSLSFQMLALYNPQEIGLYVAANDSLSYRKHFSVELNEQDELTFELTAFTDLASDDNSFSPPYEAVIGTFRGDWLTAAERYRKWGEKQKWSRDSRLINGLSPSWLEETALWVWNREESDQVLAPAVALRQDLGLPVSVLWHWWHQGSYDDSFPEYFPPREGRRSFVSAVRNARTDGVNAIVYMNQLQWGTSTESFEKDNATAYAVKDREGNIRSHVYNIFTGKSLTNMCIVTDFWKDTYASLAQRALNEYGVSGIYMDQACLSRMCYDPDHGHPLGGGNYWTRNSGALTHQIRAGTSRSNQPVLAGEGGLESYLPYLDLFLTLQVSRERYAGIGPWETIPLFQAVYHEYGVTFGSYSSLLTPPYDDKWPSKFAPEDEEAMLDEAYNRQFLMEQARSFVWGMQPTIANYRSFLATERKEEIDFLKRLAKVRYRSLDYLLYGRFVRTPNIESPSNMMALSRLSIYAGRGEGERVTSFEGEFPLLYSQAWRAENGRIGIALASISEEALPVRARFDAGDYGLPPQGTISRIGDNGREQVGSYSGSTVQLDLQIPPLEVYLLEIAGPGD
ncbi:MAG: DUF6259 domain-containing protein [Saprospiraceae bacterium]|nr:DUF6259 domain-containing protein [Saprospiraceae bacterium]